MRRLVLFKTVLVLIFGVMLAPAGATFWQPRFPDVPLPDQAQVQVVSNEMALNGLSARIYTFTIDRPREATIEYFAKLWPGRIARTRIGDSEFIAHRDGDYLVSIQLDELSAGVTQGLVSISDIFAAMNEARQAPGLNLPLREDTTVLQRLVTEDFGRHSETLILQSPDSPLQNLAWLRSLFREQGYQPLARGSMFRDAQGGAMSLNRGAEQLNLAVSGLRGQSLIAIVRVQQ